MGINKDCCILSVLPFRRREAILRTGGSGYLFNADNDHFSVQCDLFQFSLSKIIPELAA